jgi:fumarate reductase flavoprotein subunit
MKYGLVLGIAVFSVFGACLSFTALTRYESGRYRGVAEGYAGAVNVMVETDATSIIDIELLENNEDPMIGVEAIRQLKEQILETDSTDVDAISGATQSSLGFISAVENALSHARIRE